jgi:hypothetical protein
MFIRKLLADIYHKESCGTKVSYKHELTETPVPKVYG